MDAPEAVCFAFLDALLADNFDAAWACLDPSTQRAVAAGDPPLMLGIEFTGKSRRAFARFLELQRDGGLVALPISAESISAPFLEHVILTERPTAGAEPGPQLGFEVHLTDRWRIVGFKQTRPPMGRTRT